MSMIDLLFSFFMHGWKQDDVFLQIISIFCVYGQTGVMSELGQSPPRKAKGGNFKGHEDWESNQEPLLTQAAAVSGQLKGEAFGFVPIVSFFLKN